MKKIILLTVIALGCSPKSETINETALAPTVFQAHFTKDAILLDVRTPEEYGTGSIEGAVNMDFKDPAFKDKLVGLKKSATYMVYCASGARSGKAAELMKAEGFASVYTLDGGIKSWLDAGLPIKSDR